MPLMVTQPLRPGPETDVTNKFGDGAAATHHQCLSAHRGRKASRPPSWVTDEQGSWDRIDARELWNTGPRYTERSGVRRTRQHHPNWVETSYMRNVSIRGEHYGYFVSPDQRIVVLAPSTRRVALVSALTP
jgi:hypothetical protein